MASSLCLGLTFEVFSMDLLHIYIHWLSPIALWCIFMIVPCQYSVTVWHFKNWFISYFFWLYRIVRMTRIPWWIVNDDDWWGCSAGCTWLWPGRWKPSLNPWPLHQPEEEWELLDSPTRGMFFWISWIKNSPCKAWWELSCYSILCRSGSSPLRDYPAVIEK